MMANYSQLKIVITAALLAAVTAAAYVPHNSYVPHTPRYAARRALASPICLATRTSASVSSPVLDTAALEAAAPSATRGIKLGDEAPGAAGAATFEGE